MEISILIVNWNSKDYLNKCLHSIFKHMGEISHEVIVVDGGSFDGCGEMVGRDFPAVQFLQCPDNLVRTLLIRTWEAIADPRLRMRLLLAPRGRYLYEVAPHSLFMGGIQLDVQAFLEEESETTMSAMESPQQDEEGDHTTPRNHA